jgi:Domain of unknown function (DUF3883)
MDYRDLTTSSLQAGNYVAMRLASDPTATSSTVVSVAQSSPGDTRGLDFRTAQRVAEKLGWGVFEHGGDPRRAIAESYLAIIRDEKFRPPWIGAALIGRSEVSRLLDGGPDQVVLNACELLEGDESWKAEWWSRLALLSRSLVPDEDGGDFWMACEQASLAREVRKLAGTRFKPRLMSIEDCRVGYDILSFRLGSGKDEESTPLYIEVKSSEISHFKRFYISRNEWDFASAHQEQWQLDFYGPSVADITVLTFRDVEAHIPLERRGGKWTKCEILLD